MRKTLIITVLLLAAVIISSCTNNTNKNELPQGYTCEAQSGGNDLKNVNIKSVTVSAGTDTATEIRVLFAQGSELQNSGYSENIELPKYKVEKQNSPYAVTLKVDEAEYTDYERTFECPETGDILGVFFDKNTRKLNFEFAKDMAFKVEEEKSSLVIKAMPLTKQHEQDDYAYYITSNTYDYALKGMITFKDMQPTLTRSGEIVFITDEFENEKAAKQRLEELKKEYPLYERSFEIIAKYYNELPVYNEDRSNARTYSELIVRKDGKPDTAQVLLADGFYLADTDEGILYEKFIQNGESVHSEVYIRTDGESRKFFNFEFENIEKAECSPDGKKTAILENSTSGSHLYIFDVQSAELLHDLSNSGFGKRISDFVWNEAGTAIYAISGTNKMEVHMYDFTINDETKRVGVVYDGEADESKLSLYNGELYFVGTNKNKPIIYRIRPELGIKSKFKDGSAITFRGDNAAVSTADTVSQSNNHTLYILNTKTGERTDITSDFAVYDFVWSVNGKYLYYVQNRNSGYDTAGSSDSGAEKDDYPYTLYRYDIDKKASEAICDVKAYNRIKPYKDGVMLMYYDRTDIVLFAGTYVI